MHPLPSHTGSPSLERRTLELKISQICLFKIQEIYAPKYFILALKCTKMCLATGLLPDQLRDFTALSRTPSWIQTARAPNEEEGKRKQERGQRRGKREWRGEGRGQQNDTAQASWVRHSTYMFSLNDEQLYGARGLQS